MLVILQRGILLLPALLNESLYVTFEELPETLAVFLA
jgi:hypothetical protein